MLHRLVTEYDAWACVSFFGDLTNLKLILNLSLSPNSVMLFPIITLLTELVFQPLPLCTHACFGLLVSGTGQDNVFGAVFCHKHMGIRMG